jgi:outer membrane protein assembly factor BamB
MLAVCLIFCAASAFGADWPEYLHDSQRNARSPEQIDPPLHLQWVYTPRLAPSPAWPPEAKYDFYHSHPLQPLVTYDHVFEVITAAGKVFFASSGDDGLHCLDAATGKELWVYYAEAPARMAPAYADGKVFLAADDGLIHAVDAASGRRVWAVRPTDRDVRIAGNERIISVWPNRTGLVLDRDVIYAILGLFPSQKMYVTALNLADGKVLSVKPTDQPVQGYVRHWKGRLLAPRGRQLQWTVAGTTNNEITPDALKAAGPLARECPLVQIAAGNVQFGGGNGKVAAYRVTTETVKDPKTGQDKPAEKAQKLWEAAVQGQARSLAAAGGNLLVGTSTGKIYCFSAKQGQAVETAPSAQPVTLAADATTAVKAVGKALAERKIGKGYALVLSDGGDLAGALAAVTKLQVVCVVDDVQRAQALAQRFAAAGLAGRVSVHTVAADKPLPYVKWLFDVVTHDGIVTGKAVSRRAEDLAPLVRPYGGLALLGANTSVTQTTGPLKGAGQWSHFYANAENNTCSGETLLTDSLRLQWFGRPGPREMVDRHNRGVAPLCVNGRLFVSGQNQVFGVNAYNGTVLWDRSVPKSMRIHGPKVSGSMAATDETLYVASGSDCLALDAASGEVQRTFSVDGKGLWGYVASVDSVLLGSRVGPGAYVQQLSQSSWKSGYGPGQPIVCSFELLAFDRATGQKLWTYAPPETSGLIADTTLLAAGGKVFFVESKNRQTKSIGNGRVVPAHLVGQGADLVALDLKSGKEVYRKPMDLKKAQHQLWMAHSNGVLVISGVRIAGGIFTDLWAVKAADGSPLWTKANLTRGRDTKGAHGELTQHPAIIGDRVLAPPYQYDLKTGKQIEGWTWVGGSCGPISTSATHVYNRKRNPIMQSLTSNFTAPITQTTRPGCWINIISGCGMLLIPEGSSGCSCQFQIQTSLGFVAGPGRQ